MHFHVRRLKSVDGDDGCLKERVGLIITEEEELEDAAIHFDGGLALGWNRNVLAELVLAQSSSHWSIRRIEKANLEAAFLQRAGEFGQGGAGCVRGASCGFPFAARRPGNGDGRAIRCCGCLCRIGTPLLGCGRFGQRRGAQGLLRGGVDGPLQRDVHPRRDLGNRHGVDIHLGGRCGRSAGGLLHPKAALGRERAPVETRREARAAPIGPAVNLGRLTIATHADCGNATQRLGFGEGQSTGEAGVQLGAEESFGRRFDFGHDGGWPTFDRRRYGHHDPGRRGWRRCCVLGTIATSAKGGASEKCDDDALSSLRARHGDGASVWV